MIDDVNFFNKKIDIERLRSNTPSRCFIVFVGGKYVTRMDDIYLRVRKLKTALFMKSPLLFVAEKPEKGVELRNAIENKIIEQVHFCTFLD